MHTDKRTDFEVVSMKSGAGEQSREDHVDWNVNTTTDITVRNLNVLNFCCWINKITTKLRHLKKQCYQNP